MALMTTEPVRVVLLAPVAVPVLPIAATVLARHLQLTPEQAAARLHRAPGAVATGLAPWSAERLMAVLSALGLRLRCEADAATPPAAPGVDVSLQASGRGDLAAISAELAQALQRPLAEIRRDLQQPGGVILRGPSSAQVVQLRRALRRIKGLRLATCCPDKAELDLFLRPGVPLARPLLRHLALLGLQPCRFSGALATGLNRHLVDHLEARFGTLAFGLERAFQRLDLYLTGAGSLAPLDLADFLATRHPGGGKVDPISPISPLRIETGLSYPAARQFQTDYEMIGLSTFARLTPAGG